MDSTVAGHRLTVGHLFVLSAISIVVLLGYAWARRATNQHELLKAARDGNVSRLRELVRSGVDVNYRDAWDTTALMMASSNGRVTCVQILLEAGANPNERSRFESTPLIWAARSGSIENVKFLVDHGADALLTDVNKISAAEHARQSGNAELADYILGK